MNSLGGSVVKRRNLLTSYYSGKHILITGASSGLGAAIVEALAPFRVHFCLLSRRKEPMDLLASRLQSTGSGFWIRSCDVQIRSEVESAVDQYIEENGHLDIAWINSGVVGDTSFRNWNWDVVDSILNTNLRGAIYTTHFCLRYMAQRGSGTIVAISSAAAMRGLGGRALYSLTKIGLSYYMDSMAVELPQIQFTTIYPGFVDTPINQNSPNRFWVMRPQKAAHLMIRAVARRKASYIYPFRMKLLFYAIRLLPDSIYRRLAHRSMELTRPAGGT